MTFDDDFIQLTGIKDKAGSDKDTDKKSKEKLPEKKPEVQQEIEQETEQKTQSEEPEESKAERNSFIQDILSGVSTQNKWASEYGNPDGDYVIESDLVTPVIKPVKAVDEKPLIVVVDDDFETLDLLEIYLKRNYRYQGFSGPKEAVFFLNQNIPDLVLVDCKIHTMKAITFAEIVRTGAGDIPFVFTGDEYELEQLEKTLLPDYVIGTIRRPVARGDLQDLIDKALSLNKE